MKLRVATCQFPIGSDVRKNLEYVARQIRTARDRGADVAHFPEACLSGYAGADFASHEGFDWSLLEECAGGVRPGAGVPHRGRPRVGAPTHGPAQAPQ
jgi:deaminated glutathione amidase